MAFAICAGAVIFELVTLFGYPTLPLPAGERVVQIRSRDLVADRPEERLLYDFVVWRDELTSITDPG